MDRDTTRVLDTVHRALAEDLGVEEARQGGGVGLSLDGDITSCLAVPAGRRGRARIRAKGEGCIAGTRCAVLAFRLLDPDATIEVLRGDGDVVVPGDDVLEIVCAQRALLAAERTALNFLQRLSGIATLTRKFVRLVAGTGARILDTRKTTPGLRFLEKEAVRAGGGDNHRFGLFDQVLLKENHFALAAPHGYEDVVRACVVGQRGPVIAEARTVDEALAAVRGGAAVVLLDNFAAGPGLVQAVRAIRAAAVAIGRTIAVEASGGVDQSNVRAYAECGVDRISIGAITHSAPALDLSLLEAGLR
jgi:nicotinate-nucleotide pyrophosphorylase (carboxylating)